MPLIWQFLPSQKCCFPPLALESDTLFSSPKAEWPALAQTCCLWRLPAHVPAQQPPTLSQQVSIFMIAPLTLPQRNTAWMAQQASPFSAVP